MPILPRQHDLFPADLLDADSPAVAPAAQWLAFYTLSRREKDLMRKLEAVGIPFYAPLIRRRLKSPGGRTRESHVPLFPGYVFSCVDDDQRRAALATNTIARWLPITDEAALLADLRGIKQLIDTDCPLGQRCALDQTCQEVGAQSDAGESADAGRPADAGSPDAGPSDAGAADGGDVDAGDGDAGDVDAGDVDAGDVAAGAA
jgi:hypothetical protein